MEQLIFVAIIVIFSILDSVARTKKKRQMRGPLPAPDASRDWEGEESYDAEPSYDEVELEREEAEAKAEPLPRYTQPYGSSGADKTARPTRKTSEGLIPADIWAEIAGLAKERLPAPEKPAPKPVSKPAPKPLPERPGPKHVSRRSPPRPVETHRVHRAHAGFGTDPVTRAPSEQDGLDPLARELGLDAASARRQLLSRDRHALRQAVILQEILGPPAALRPDPFEE